MGGFSAHLITPGHVVTTAPAWPAQTVDRMLPLSFAWTGVSAGVLEATLRANAYDGTFLRTVCRFPAVDGAGVMPQAVLTLFDKGPGYAPFSRSIEAIVVVDDVRNAGNYGPVSVRAAAVALAPNGVTPYVLPVDFK